MRNRCQLERYSSFRAIGTCAIYLGVCTYGTSMQQSFAIAVVQPGLHTNLASRHNLSMDTDLGPRKPQAAPPRASRLVVTPALLAVIAAVFTYVSAHGISVLGGRLDEYLRFGANFAPLTTAGGWWR